MSEPQEQMTARAKASDTTVSAPAARIDDQTGLRLTALRFLELVRAAQRRNGDVR